MHVSNIVITSPDNRTSTNFSLSLISIIFLLTALITMKPLPHDQLWGLEIFSHLAFVSMFFLKSLHANEAMRMSTNICLCCTLRTFDTGQFRSLAASPLHIYFFFCHNLSFWIIGAFILAVIFNLVEMTKLNFQVCFRYWNNWANLCIKLPLHLLRSVFPYTP